MASRAARRAAFDNQRRGRAGPSPVDKVVRHAWKVTGDDVAAAKTAGVSEDEIFELAVCAALGQATRQLDAALAALDAATQSARCPRLRSRRSVEGRDETRRARPRPPLTTRALFALIRLISGHRAPDVVKTLGYRPDFFGAPMGDVFQEVMRGPSDWSIGDRELMAAYVSKVNACEF